MPNEVSIEIMQDRMEGMQEELKGINVTLGKHSEQIKAALKRIDEQAQLTETVHKLATSIELLVAKQEITSEKVAETNKKLEAITHDVEDIKQKPAKRWDDSVKAILLGLIAGIVAFFLSKIGLG